MSGAVHAVPPWICFGATLSTEQDPQSERHPSADINN